MYVANGARPGGVSRADPGDRLGLMLNLDDDENRGAGDIPMLELPASIQTAANSSGNDSGAVSPEPQT